MDDGQQRNPIQFEAWPETELVGEYKNVNQERRERNSRRRLTALASFGGKRGRGAISKLPDQLVYFVFRPTSCTILKLLVLHLVKDFPLCPMKSSG